MTVCTVLPCPAQSVLLTAQARLDEHDFRSQAYKGTGWIGCPMLLGADQGPHIRPVSVDYVIDTGNEF